MIKYCVVFDLDDTLYKERDFVRSAFSELADRFSNRPAEAFEAMWGAFERGENAFQALNEFAGLHTPIAQYLEIYRSHFPEISLEASTRSTLAELVKSGNITGLISDGRSVSQRNKIEALGLRSYIGDKDIVISEEFGSSKPDERNFRVFMDAHPDCDVFVYVGDNYAKDFVAPNRLGWITIALKDDGRNIHGQKIQPEDIYNPQTVIESLSELKKVLPDAFLTKPV